MPKKFELKINPELEAIVPKMTDAEFESLKYSILEEGLKIPIECMIDGTIIDGHNRFKACGIVGVEPKYKVIEEIKTIEEAKNYAVITNLKRRHLNAYQKAEYALTVLPQRSMDISQEKMCEAVGVGHNLMAQVAVILRQASEETKQQLRNGEVSAKSVYTALGLAEQVKEKMHYLRPEVKQMVEEKYAEQLTNPETLSRGMVDKITHDIDEAKGVIGNSYLKTFYYEEEKFKTEQEAEEFAKKRGGRVITKVTKVVWELKLDYIKVKQLMDED